MSRHPCVAGRRDGPRSRHQSGPASVAARGLEQHESPTCARCVGAWPRGQQIESSPSDRGNNVVPGAWPRLVISASRLPTCDPSPPRGSSRGLGGRHDASASSASPGFVASQPVGISSRRLSFPNFGRLVQPSRQRRADRDLHLHVGGRVQCVIAFCIASSAAMGTARPTASLAVTRAKWDGLVPNLHPPIRIRSYACSRICPTIVMWQCRRPLTLAACFPS